MSETEAVFEAGDIVADRYEIVEELGRGSYGVVYRAVQLGIGRDVAIKTLLPDTEVGSEEQQRFEREAMLISRLNHPNIVTLFDYGEHQGVLFMAMEFVDGRNLKEVIEAQAPMEPQRVRGLIYQMLDALQFAHDLGVVHRDLKPENIQLVRNPSMAADEPDALKVLDFGIAKVVHGTVDGSPLNTLTQTGMAMGTPQYMSPENITGDPVSHHADLYAVGLLLYEMLTGKPAFSAAGPREVMAAHVRDEPPPLPDEPGLHPFRRGLAQALKKQPDERVQSARELRAIFEEDGPAAPMNEVPSPSQGGRRGRELSLPLVVAVVAASIVTFLMMVVVILQLSVGDDPPAPQVVVVEEVMDGDPEEVEQVVKGGDLLDEAAITPQAQERGQAVELVIDGEDALVVESAAEVEIEIISDPAAARISVDGRPLGVSPVIYRAPRGDRALEIEVSLTGYNDAVRAVVPDRSQTLEVKLERGRLILE